MGTTNTKKEIKVHKNEIVLNYPKKMYHFSRKEFNKCPEKKLDQPEFSLDLKPISIEAYKPIKIKDKKKQDSPKKKFFKQEENPPILSEMHQKVSNSNVINPRSPKLKIPRHSICYDGEFSIKLKPVPDNVEEKKESKKIVKDLSCFNILKVIGRGTFGKVVLVRNKMDNQLLALKCIKKSQILRNKNIENIKNEKNILQNLDHPFIIKLHYTFQNKDKIFMAFDYYNGGELFFHLQKHRRFSENLTRFYASEIYLALRYLHKENIIYRDLKPENIILDKTGHLKLIDFGLAKGNISTSNPTTTICGTNEYIPPEVICGKKYSFNFDWWGFGNILYEMLFGYPAFNDQNKTNLFKKIVYYEPTFKGANLSPEALDLLKKLLKKDPKERIKSEDIPFHPWFKGVNFEDLGKLKVTPPFVPKIKNEEDLSNIDPTFLNENINSPVKSFNQIFDQNYFSDF